MEWLMMAEAHYQLSMRTKSMTFIRVFQALILRYMRGETMMQKMNFEIIATSQMKWQKKMKNQAKTPTSPFKIFLTLKKKKPTIGCTTIPSTTKSISTNSA